LKRLCEKRPCPGGWRASSQFTHAENAAAGEILERELERAKPFTFGIAGRDFGCRGYLLKRTGDLTGPERNRSKLGINTVLIVNRDILRKRNRWNLYFSAAQFEKAWRKRLITIRGAQKTVIDS
jgi:hypothetical protein